MKVIKHPAKSDWDELLKRPSLEASTLQNQVGDILKQVKEGGDEALLSLTQRFDCKTLTILKATEQEISNASVLLSDELKEAISKAASNIRKFHSLQQRDVLKVETQPGVSCWRKSVAIDKVGLYIPGGTAPLFSTVLMLAIPAKIAGCKEIVLCTPPSEDGTIHPAILYAAGITGINTIIKAGGAQAIAAMAYGTRTVPKTYKIFGPGNQYVTEAKQQVSLDGIAIDMPAGPSEVAIIADETANPQFVAADLLSQAEHGVDSQVILFTDSATLIEEVKKEVNTQLAELPRKEMAEKSLANSKAFLCETTEEAIEMSNAYAPEHLIICTENLEETTSQITNAGSVFIGNYTPESAGDYASGTNHTLPTNGAARAFSGVSLDSFTKQITFQQITKEGLIDLGPTIETMAEAELLQAHKNAVTVRLNEIKKNGN